LAGEDTSTSSLAERYATALFDLAETANKLDEVADDLRGLKAAIGGSDDLQRLIRSPLYGRGQQAAAMAAVLDKAGVQDLTRRFVLVAAQNRRLFAVPGMINAYLAELARRRGEVTAEVTAARELTADQRKALGEALGKAVGGNVQMNLKVDPSLLGGLMVKVGSRMIDSSVKSKLQRLKFAMKGVG
jgi:F-type H+-transporting ATPase subunit delta